MVNAWLRCHNRSCAVRSAKGDTTTALRAHLPRHLLVLARSLCRQGDLSWNCASNVHALGTDRERRSARHYCGECLLRYGTDTTWPPRYAVYSASLSWVLSHVSHALVPDLSRSVGTDRPWLESISLPANLEESGLTPTMRTGHA